jgi:hypothetical protein
VIRPILAALAGSVVWASIAASPAAGAQPAPECGPDQATAMEPVLALLRPEPWTDKPWNPNPVAANYNPCADLSTVLLTIDGARPNSPVQALMFHRGQYLSTATYKAYPYTTLDTAGSTGDTVVLDYKTPAVCDGCDSEVTSVRYQWQGDHMAMLDPGPSL